MKELIYFFKLNMCDKKLHQIGISYLLHEIMDKIYLNQKGGLMYYIIPIIFLLLTLGSMDVQAQEKKDEQALLLLYGDEEMISIATGIRQPLSKAPAVATTITSEDIKAIGATDLDDVLETVPGLHVARDFEAYTPIYIIRGIFSQFNPQVLVLINGIPATNLFFGNRGLAWAGMPVQSIERIEIIRGPGSAIYGADAFAGVINIITKTSRDINGTEVGGRVASFDTQDAWLLHGGTWGGFDIAFMLEYGNTDGQRNLVEADAQTIFDNIFSTDVSLAPGPLNLQRENIDARLDIAKGYWRLRAGLQRRQDIGTGAGIGQALDPAGRFSSDRWNADLTYHDPSFVRDLDVNIQLSYFDTSQEVDRNVLLFPPGTIVPLGPDGNINPLNAVEFRLFPNGVIGNPEVFERHYRIDTSAYYSAFENHELRVGAGYKFNDLYKVAETKNFGPDPETGEPLPPGSPVVNVSDTPFVFLEEGNRENYYFFAQDVWSFARDWELTAGMRYDYFSDFGDTINPRLALVWNTRYDLTTKFLYGRAFRAPSFAETRNINNPVALGNPDLDPETIDTLELAFDYRPKDKLRFGLNLFGYVWDDIIRFIPDPGAATATAQNTGQQNGYGLEFEVDWDIIDGVNILGNYSFQRSIDEATDDEAGNAPGHQLYLRGEWEFLPNWNLSSQVNWIIDRERSPGDDRTELDDYAIADLVIRRKKYKDNWGFAFSVRNLFDSDAREPSPSGQPVAPIPNDLPLAGRSFFAEVRFGF